MSCAVARVTVPPPIVVRVTTAGAQGPPGTGGSGSAGYTHTQATPLATWNVNHNLGFQPVTEVQSVGGQKLLAEVSHLNLNTLQITFTVPQAGTARMV